MDNSQTIEWSDYMGRKVHTFHFAPDVGVEIDGAFLGFYLSSSAALNGAQKHIQLLEEDKNE